MTAHRGPWRLVTLLSATATVAYICRVNVSTAGPLLMKEFSLSQVEMGNIFTAFLLGYAFSQVPAGMLADTWRVKKIFRWATLLWVAITVLQTLTGRIIFSFNPGYALIFFMVCRFLLGIAASPAYPGSAKAVSLFVPVPFQGRANGLVIASIGLGSALSPPLVSYIMVHSGWRMALIASAIPALLIGLIWMKWKEPDQVRKFPREEKAEKNHETISFPLRSKHFVLLTLSYTLQGYVGYIFISWFYLYLVQERHFGLLSGAWMSSMPWVLSVLSIPLGGWISDILVAGRMGMVWGRRLVPFLGMTLSGILISAGAHTGNAIFAAISLALATAFILSVESPFWSTMIQIAGKNSGRGGGIMNFGSNLGGLLSPSITPLIASHIGWENALHIAAVLSLTGAVLWLFIRPGQTR